MVNNSWLKSLGVGWFLLLKLFNIIRNVFIVFTKKLTKKSLVMMAWGQRHWGRHQETVKHDVYLHVTLMRLTTMRVHEFIHPSISIGLSVRPFLHSNTQSFINKCTFPQIHMLPYDMRSRYLHLYNHLSTRYHKASYVVHLR